jgi:hypothetical protein
MILAALPLLAGLTGCKSDEETTARPAKETLIVQGGDITFASSEEKKYVDITADCSWHVVDFQIIDPTTGVDVNKSQRGDFGDKLSVEPMRGNGNSTLIVNIDRNSGTLKRGNAYIILQSDGGLRQRVNITQLSSDPGMSIAGTTDGGLDFTMAGGVKTLTIESNTSWTVETQYDGLTSDWITLNKASGNGNDFITVTTTPETTGQNREATLIFKYGSKVASIPIRQGAKTDITLSLDKQGILFNVYYMPEEQWQHEREHMGEHWDEQWESQTVKVTSNASWIVSILGSESWLKVDRTNGVGNGEFTVSCSSYTTDVTGKQAVIMVVAGNKTSYLFISQAVEGYSEDKLTVTTLYSMSVFDNYANFRFDFVYGEQGNNERVGDYGVVYSAENTNPTVDNSTKVVAGSGKTSGSVAVEAKGLKPSTKYYVRGFVYGGNGVKYTSNVVTITTSSGSTIPGESDNPDPNLARQF